MPLVFGGGSRNNDLVNGVGTYSKVLYIPLKFWFNKISGMYLPLAALYKHNVNLQFDIETINNLIGNNTNITNMSINFQVYGNFITLDEDEKRKFSQSNHEYVIEQLQLNDGEQGFQTTSNVEVNNNPQINIDENFNSYSSKIKIYKIT
mgnify:CR=1 FL=1